METSKLEVEQIINHMITSKVLKKDHKLENGGFVRLTYREVEISKGPETNSNIELLQINATVNKKQLQ